MNLEAISWRQKDRERWIKESDRNTKYFHSLANFRKKNNFVEELEFDGDTVRGNAVLKEKAKDYFTKLYTEEEERRPRLDELPFRQLSAGSKEGLEVPFMEEEILDCLRQCNGDKGPRPDGFHMKFFQDFWAVIKYDIMAFFHDFHRTRAFVKPINATFLVIIPKIVGACNIKDFRPISLVDSTYKLISNILAKRMSKVLGEVLFGRTNAFVEGRQILDVVMVANEVVDDMMGQKKEGIICKIDMEKA
ncbi:uncharacterized protein LOC110808320 [Carica papaya]|uniref:uncharacterized protein LOC110808320 n=1 Tax=Carica papaya TaxID=3649 RepID=UPI000B8C7877|nr:uncharacterized protein LOC110808320 [Carica papaya]